MSLKIGSTTFADSVTGMHGIAGNYWINFRIGGPQYAIERVHAPGEAGCKVKRHGFNSRRFEAMVIIVGASVAACVTSYNGFVSAIVDKAITITPPGGADLEFCEVTEVETVKGPRATGSGTFVLHIHVIADQLRDYEA